MARLVILGTGWASYSLLKSINKSLYHVIVVSPRNHFLFTPLLCSTTVGTLEFRSIIEPIRNIGFANSDDFHLASAETVDFQKKFISCCSTFNSDNKFDLSYDKLVIGVGALPNTLNIPGVLENSLFLKELSDARIIRTRLLANIEHSLVSNLDDFERSILTHVVIVGGGPTGIEFGAELYDFCKTDIARLYRNYGLHVKVTLIENNKILSSFDQRLQAYAEKKLAMRENFKLVKSNVVKVETNGVFLQDGTFLPCGIVVWSTGLAPRPFVDKMDVRKNKMGQLLTDNYVKLISHDNVFAIGDCADIVNLPLPCTAQVAERQGRYLANELNKQQKGVKTASPFSFKSMGMLAYIGDYEGLSDLPDFKFKGFCSWFLWRSAYLTRLGSWRLRLQVPLDWLKTLIFGRDTSRF